jgi:RimJ/RimL family protein N-acetyltransferase
MQHQHAYGAKIRKLWPAELDLYQEHLIRLDRESRRLRFGMAPSDAFIRNHAAQVNDHKSLVYAYLEDGHVRAAAELRPLGSPPHSEAEAAFSVEQSYQDGGLGTELLGRVIRAARNRGMRRLYMNCMLENRKMQRVAKKYDAVLQFERGDVIGKLAPLAPNCFSIWHEMVENERGFVMAVFDFQRRMMRAA